MKRASMIPMEIKEMVVKMYNGYCGVKGCVERAQDIHHKVSNSKGNARNWPLFINSPMNLMPLCRKHHEDGKVLKDLKWTINQAELYEEYLISLKRGDNV